MTYNDWQDAEAANRKERDRLTRPRYFQRYDLVARVWGDRLHVEGIDVERTDNGRTYRQYRRCTDPEFGSLEMQLLLDVQIAVERWKMGLADDITVENAEEIYK